MQKLERIGDFVLTSDALPQASGDRCETLVQLAGLRAARHPDRTLFTFLGDGENETDRLSFCDLDRRARAAGAALRARGAAGERVLLAYPQGLDFVVAFFAVLHAGAVAVPAPAPNGGRMARERIGGIVGDAAPLIALTTDALAEDTRALLNGAVPVAVLADLEREGEGGQAPGPVDPAALALLQYTSGSTGTPKGVMVSHASIMHNQALIGRRFEHDADTVFVGWLPMFHDMGLIGNMLQPVHAGCHCVLMSPIAFLEEPARWLRAITRYGGTTAGAPNFAYDLCVDRIRDDQRVGLDLRCWDVAYNGSEPVRARTLARFSQSFAPQGFRREAFYPCYGMAEATLLIAGPTKAHPPAMQPDKTEVASAPRPLVGCGRTGPGHDIRIVDPDTHREVAPGTVGEIWFAGGSVAQGYWNRPEETRASFDARLNGRADGQADGQGYGYLRTGDLGFLQGNELFVTGRIKDVMIVRGKNHYPQDIEATVAGSFAAFRPDCGAAFLVERDDGDRLVVVQEIAFNALRKHSLKQIAGAIRAAVSRAHGLHVAAVVLVKTGAIPKTSSGKIRRRESRQRYLTRGFTEIGEDRHGPPLRPGPVVEMARA